MQSFLNVQFLFDDFAAVVHVWFHRNTRVFDSFGWETVCVVFITRFLQRLPLECKHESVEKASDLRVGTPERSLMYVT